MKKNFFNQGTALIAVVSTVAIALIVIATSLVVSVINARMSLDQQRAQRAQQVAESLLNDVILKFVRMREETVNQYPDWTENCLQTANVQCKMELNLNASGGTIDAWAKSSDVLKHWQATLEVLGDDSVTVSARREVN